MCYGIKGVIGKKVRDVVRVQQVSSPEKVAHSKMAARVQAWLKRLGPKECA